MCLWKVVESHLWLTGRSSLPPGRTFRSVNTHRTGLLQVLQLGSFGGTYFRPIYSSVTQTQYDDKQWAEFPKDWCVRGFAGGREGLGDDLMTTTTT